MLKKGKSDARFVMQTIYVKSIRKKASSPDEIVGGLALSQEIRQNILHR